MRLFLLVFAYTSAFAGPRKDPAPNKNASADKACSQADGLNCVDFKIPSSTPAEEDESIDERCLPRGNSFEVDKDCDDAPNGPKQECEGTTTFSGLIQGNAARGNESVVSLAELNPDISVFHKIDVDAVEDRCIQRIELTRSKDRGCEMHLVFEGPAHTSRKSNHPGGLLMKEGVLHADSFCPGWLDEHEGTYRFAIQDGHGPILLELRSMNVSDPVADYSCMTNHMEVPDTRNVWHDSRKNFDLFLRNLAIDATALSTGDTPGYCLPPQNGPVAQKARKALELDHYLDLMYRMRLGEYLTCSGSETDLDGVFLCSTGEVAPRLSYYLGGRYSVGTWVRYSGLIDLRIPTKTALVEGATYAPSVVTVAPIGVAVGHTITTFSADLYALYGKAFVQSTPVSRGAPVSIVGSTQRLSLGSSLYLATDLSLRSTKEHEIIVAAYDNPSIPDSTAKKLTFSLGMGFQW